MQSLKKLFDFYIFSNIHVAIGVFCFAKITLLHYGILENNSSLFVFFSTIVAYNFIRFYRATDIKNWLSDWLNHNRSILYVLVLICVVGVSILGLTLKTKALLYLFPFIVCTFFYVVPIPILKASLRKIPGVKLFLIAFSFAGITVLFPLVQNNILIGYNEWIIFMQRFLFVVLITIPFDIRDLYCDDASMKTLPQSIGVKNAKIIGVLFGLLFVVLEFFKEPVDDLQVVIAVVVAIISSLFLIMSNKKQTKYYSAFYLESMPIFWWILFLSIRNF